MASAAIGIGARKANPPAYMGGLHDGRIVRGVSVNGGNHGPNHAGARRDFAEAGHLRLWCVPSGARAEPDMAETRGYFAG